MSMCMMLEAVNLAGKLFERRQIIQSREQSNKISGIGHIGLEYSPNFDC